MRRVQRVASLLNEELSLLINNTLDESCGIVTLTKIDLQPDLKAAKIYISCFDENSENRVLKILKSKTIQYQHILGKRLKMRYTPRLFFYLDNSNENVEKVVDLLCKIKDNKEDQ